MSWWLRKCFFLFCIMEDDLWDIMLQHVAALPNFFCQTSHLWISLTVLSELSVFHQKFSINNEALQVWRWHPSVKLHVCWQLAGIDSGRCDGLLYFCRVFSRKRFLSSRGAASHRRALWQAISSQGEWNISETGVEDQRYKCKAGRLSELNITQAWERK